MSYFAEKEFDCKCGCGGGFRDMDRRLIEKLQFARQVSHTPFVINSAYRCTEHNKAVGGSETSSHLKGYAVDIATTSNRQRMMIIEGIVRAGISRIGIASNFIHCDLDPEKSVALWLYKGG